MESTALTCPDCGGVLTEHASGTQHSVRKYTCYLGHAYSPYVLNETTETEVGQALWGAVRRLEEQVMFSRRLAGEILSDAMAGFAGELKRKAELAERHAAIIRGLLERSAAQAREAKEDAVTAADQRAA